MDGAMRKQKIRALVIGLVVLMAVNLLASLLHVRFDLTEDQRYTLSGPAEASVNSFTAPVIVDVLLNGNLPPEFIKLKEETDQILQEFALRNENIKFDFVDPLEDESQTASVMAQLQGMGLTPTQITTEDNGKVSQELLFPWAIVTHGNKSVKVPLLRNKLGSTTEERVNNSVQGLEFAFANAFSKLAITEKKTVAVIKGNGELDDIHIADYLTSIKDYYNIGAITLDSVGHDTQGTLDALKKYDLALVAKPTQAFTDAEKYVMDQYVAGGGKSIWLVDPVAIELDSLFNDTGASTAIPRDLNLNDFFFKYGVRLNPVLVSDMYCSQIVLATGEGNSSQYDPVPWRYNPMVFSKNNHPINNNLEALRFQFTSTLDTLANPYKKTILYQSSPLSRVEGTPEIVSLDAVGIPADKENYNNGNHPLAVLLEGAFKSAFVNRVKPVDLAKPVEQGPENKMLVIADGDLIKNQTRKGRPLELGYDKWTNNFYGNKEFLINAINYMLEDNGLINIRNKKVAVPMLDSEKIAEQKTTWQLINIGVPVVLTLVLGLVFTYFRKKRYSS